MIRPCGNGITVASNSLVTFADNSLLLPIVLTFLLAGAVKGVIGMGLPTIALAIFAVIQDLTVAMTLLVMPSLITNCWQAATGGNLVKLGNRLWPFLLAASVTIFVGALALSWVKLEWLSALLGLLLVVYALSSLAGLTLSINVAMEGRAGPVTGVINGVLTGMTGSFVVPGVMYLQALGLERDQLVQAMGMLFTVSTVALGLALILHDRMDWNLGLLSMIGVVPALIGMVIGQLIRQRLSQQVFRKVFFISVLLLGVYIVFNSYLDGA